MYRLTNPQKLIYDMEKYAGGATAVICGNVLVDGTATPLQLTKAVNKIFEINDALRTRITEIEAVPYQQIVPYEPQIINVLHFDVEAQLHSYAEAYAKEPIPLTGDLCNIQAVFLPDRFGLLIKSHHIISDAWTLTLICSQLNAILAGELPSAFPYAEYAENEAAYMHSQRYIKDRSFFLEQFKSCDEAIYLSEKPGHSCEAQRKTFHMDTVQTGQIRSWANKHSTSPFVLFLTAFAVYFSRVKMNTEKFYIGTPILNRSTFKEKNTMGMFINTVPILSSIDYGATFAENLAVMQAGVFSALRHQKFHYGNLLAAIRQEFNFTEKLYDVILSYQNAAVTGASSGISTTWYHNGFQTESLQIHIDDRDGEGAFRIQMDYRVDKFSSQEIERMYMNIHNLLTDAVSYDWKKPGELSLLSEGEKKQLLHEFNNTSVDYPRDKCVHIMDFDTDFNIEAFDGAKTNSNINDKNIPSGYVCREESDESAGAAPQITDDKLRSKIIKSCLAIASVGEPIYLSAFAIELQKNDINYHEYGFSKLIELLKSQNSYLSIEGIGTVKYVKLLESQLTNDEVALAQQLTDKSMQRQNSSTKSGDATSLVSTLLHDIYLGHIPTTLKVLEMMLGNRVSLADLAQNYQLYCADNAEQTLTTSLDFYTGFQHPQKGKIYMHCVPNERLQPWKYKNFYYNSNTQALI